MLNPLRSRFGVVIIVVAAIAVYVGYKQFQKQQRQALYDEGTAAYETGDCEGALAKFDEMGKADESQSGRIEEIRAECGVYIAGVQAEGAGDYPTALHQYINILGIEHPDSPTLPEVNERITNLISEQGAANAGAESCTMTVLDYLHDLPAVQADLPALYLACARFLLDNESYMSAVATLQALLEGFPDDDLSADAQALLPEAFLGAANTIASTGNPGLEDLDTAAHDLSAILADYPDSSAAAEAAALLPTVLVARASSRLDSASTADDFELVVSDILTIFSSEPDGETLAQLGRLLRELFASTELDWANFDAQEVIALAHFVVDNNFQRATEVIEMLDRVAASSPDLAGQDDFIEARVQASYSAANNILTGIRSQSRRDDVLAATLETATEMMAQNSEERERLFEEIRIPSMFLSSDKVWILAEGLDGNEMFLEAEAGYRSSIDLLKYVVENDPFPDAENLLVQIAEYDAVAWHTRSITPPPIFDEMFDRDQWAAGLRDDLRQLIEVVEEVEDLSTANPEAFARAEFIYAEAVLNYLDTIGDEDIGEIVQPDGISIDSSNAMITIQNASPTRLQIMLIGPRTYVETVEICETCEIYQGTGPASCPEDGSEESYTIAPGTYSIVVSSVSDRVIPFRGSWDLQAGFAYPRCFFLVRN